VALAHGDRIEERSASRPGEQLKLLLPMALEVLEGRRELARIGVAVGPGSFTGLRLALTTAKTMAQILGCPLVPLSTLDVIAFGIADDCDARRICAMTDARKGQIFAACYDVEAAGITRVGEHEVLDPDDAREWLRARLADRTVVGGTALGVYREILRGAGSFGEAPGLPRARTVARAARGDYGPVREVPYAEVAPLYLRPPDVKKPKLPPLRDLS
jgi:tRNA threonylcarbamoyladenosine biosynthesis protein TsaB